jgi:hypothetical protein
MLDFIRRFIPGLEQPAAPAPRRRKKRSAPRYDASLSEPPPLADVLASEDENSDWAMWEDSVQQTDSQLQSLSPLERRQLHGVTSSRFGELAPVKADADEVLGRVGKNHET